MNQHIYAEIKYIIFIVLSSYLTTPANFTILVEINANEAFKENCKRFDTMINYREIRPEQSDKPCVYFRWNHLSI